MMKKLLSFMLILCIAGAASAGSLTLQPISEGQPGSATNPLDPGETAIVQVWTDTPMYGVDLSLVVDSGNGQIIDGSGKDDAAGLGFEEWASFDPQSSGTVAGALEIGLGGFTAPVSGPVVGWWVIESTGAVDVVVTMHADSGYGGSSDDTFATPDPIGGTVTVYQTPEPITIALLGLGGLFLRRRK